MDEIFSQMPENFKRTEEFLFVVGILFFALILIELGFDYFSKNRKRVYRQSFVDGAVYIGHELAGKLGGSFLFLSSLRLFEKIKLYELPVTPLTWVYGFFAAEFLYYWSHRLEHRSRLFWSWHNVHHSSNDFNGTTALRLAWLEPFVSWYLLVPMVIVGFNAFQTLLLFQILLTYQTWIHTRKIGRLGWFEKIFNSPSSHRVHHGSNPQYLDKNFGAVLIIWDRIFGTYEPEVEEVRYGLTTEIGTNNPIRVNFHEPAKLLKGLVTIQGFRNKMRWLFWPPD